MILSKVSLERVNFLKWGYSIFITANKAKGQGKCFTNPETTLGMSLEEKPVKRSEQIRSPTIPRHPYHHLLQKQVNILSQSALRPRPD